MQQGKKNDQKVKKKRYSDEELTALGIFKEHSDSDKEQEKDSSQ